MKHTKKLFASIATLAIAAFAAFGASACGGNVNPPSQETDKLQILRNAVEMQPDNLTVMTTDTRTDKFDYYVPKASRLWTEGDVGKSYLDDSDNPLFPMKKYTSAKREGDFVYTKTCTENLEMQGTEYEFQVFREESNLNNYGDYSQGNNPYTSGQWIGRFAGCWRQDWFFSCYISASNGGTALGFEDAINNIFNNPDYSYSYDQSSNTFVFGGIYFATVLNMNVTGYYPCSLSVKLDGQNRLSKTVCNFKGNGSLTSVYGYTNTDFDIPQNVLDLLEAA